VFFCHPERSEGSRLSIHYPPPAIFALLPAARLSPDTLIFWYPDTLFVLLIAAYGSTLQNI